MRYPSGPASRDVFAGGFKTSPRLGKSGATAASSLRPCSSDTTRSQAAETGRSMGGGVSKILGRVARPPGRLFGNHKQIQERQRLVRCVPSVFHDLALVAAGAGSTGGLAALALAKFTKRKQNIGGGQ